MNGRRKNVKNNFKDKIKPVVNQAISLNNKTSIVATLQK